MAITSLLPTDEQAAEYYILRSMQYMLRTRTLTWEGTADSTLLTAFSGVVISYGDSVYLVSAIPSLTVNFELESLSIEPLELGLSSQEARYLLTVTAWTKSSPSSTTDDMDARRDAEYELLQIGNFVDRLMTANHRHIDLVDGDNATVGSMVVTGWTGMRKVPGEYHRLGRCTLSVEMQKTT